MPTNNRKIGDFSQLDTWKKARELRRAVYTATRSFPRDETYVLTAQMRRAALSVTANIAEGYGRFSYKENLQFCRQSRGSAYELRDHFTTALDEQYFARDRFLALNSLAIDVIRLLNGYMRSTKKLQDTKTTGRTE